MTTARFEGFSGWGVNGGALRFATGSAGMPPIKRININASWLLKPVTVTIPAGESRVVWSHLDNNGFDALTIQTSHACDLLLIQDTPTSATNLTPSGVEPRVSMLQIRSHMPFTLPTSECVIDPTPANYLVHTDGIPATVNTNVAGGRLYYATVWNRNAFDVRVSVTAVGERYIPQTVIANQPPEQSGLLPFTTIIPWAGAVQLYVDSATGNDANTGTEASPLATVAEAATRLNFPSGSIRRLGGIVWIKRGNVYTGDTLNSKPDGIGVRHIYGGTAGQPLIYAAYGSGVRPIITPPAGVSALYISGGEPTAGSCGPVHCYGLEFRGPVDGSGVRLSESIGIIGTNGPLYMEDCKIHRFAYGVRAQGQSGRVIGVTLWRCIIADIRAGYHCQGTFTSGVDDVLVEECVIYDTGNLDQFCHGNYWVHDARGTRKFINNIVIKPGSAGIQCRGGLFEVKGNLFLECGNSIGIGHPNGTSGGVTVRGVFDNNWSVNTRGAADGAWLPDVGIALENCENVFIRRNRMYGAATPFSLGGIPATNPTGTYTLVDNYTAGTNRTYTLADLVDRTVNRAGGIWAVNHQASYIANEIGANA